VNNIAFYLHKEKEASQDVLISYQQFCFDVEQTRKKIRYSNAKSILFFESDRYRFCVGFFALCCEQRHILLPPNA
jgi:hypothetical protein